MSVFACHLLHNLSNIFGNWVFKNRIVNNKNFAHVGDFSGILGDSPRVLTQDKY